MKPCRDCREPVADDKHKAQDGRCWHCDMWNWIDSRNMRLRDNRTRYDSENPEESGDEH